MAGPRGGRQRHYKKKSGGDKEEGIELEGLISEILPNALFRVKLIENNQEVLAYVAGKMRKGYMRIQIGDKVKVEFSPYDLTRCRINYKYPN